MSPPSSPAYSDPEELLRHSAWMRRLALGLLGDHQGAEDAMQQAWLMALEHPPRRGGSWRAWLNVVTRNAALQERRGGARRSRRELRAGAAAIASADPLDPAELASKAEAHRAVVAELLRLEEPFRATLLLVFFGGLTPKAAARELQISAETVRSRIHRGLKKLRKRLHAQWGADWYSSCLLLTTAPRGLGLAGTLGAVTVLLATAGTWAVLSSSPSGPVLKENGAVAAGVPESAELGERERSAGRDERTAMALPPVQPAPGEGRPAAPPPVPRAVQLVDPDGLPASGARYAIFHDSGLLVLGEADLSGRLRVPSEAAGGTVLAAFPGCAPRTFAIPEQRGEARLAFPRGGLVAGRVIWEGGAPPGQVLFRLESDRPWAAELESPAEAWNHVAPGGGGELSVALRANESFRFSGLPEGWSGALVLGGESEQDRWLAAPVILPAYPISPGDRIVLLKPEPELLIRTRARSGLRGKLVGPAGLIPAAGVTLVARVSWRSGGAAGISRSTAVTDRDGSFGFPVEVRELEALSLEGVLPDRGQVLDLELAKTEIPESGDLGILVMQRSRRLHLYVTDFLGAPIGRATVEWQGLSGGPSGADGALLLEGLPPARPAPGGERKGRDPMPPLQVHAPGWRSATLPLPQAEAGLDPELTVVLEAARDLRLVLEHRGETCASVPVKLFLDSSYLLLPRDGVSGPLSEARYLRLLEGRELERLEQPFRGAVVVIRPSGNGGITLAGLEPGDRLVASLLDLNGLSFQRQKITTGDGSGSDEIRVELRGELTRVRLRALDPDGDPVPGARILAVKFDGGLGFPLGRTGADGRADLGWLCFGGGALRVVAPDFLPAELSADRFLDPAATVDIALLQGRKLRVEVLSHDGSPVSRLRLEAFRDQTSFGTALELGGGSYLFRALPPEQVEVRAGRFGASWRVRAEAEQEEVRLQLPALGRIVVAVDQSDLSYFMKGTRVELERRLETGEKLTEVLPLRPGPGQEGSVVFEHLPAGDYRVSLLHERGWPFLRSSLTLREGELRRVRLARD